MDFREYFLKFKGKYIPFAFFLFLFLFSPLKSQAFSFSELTQVYRQPMPSFSYSANVLGSGISFFYDKYIIDPLGTAIFELNFTPMAPPAPRVPPAPDPVPSPIIFRNPAGANSSEINESAILSLLRNLLARNEFSSLRGPKGDTGAMGATGPRGPKGEPGDTSNLVTKNSYDHQVDGLLTSIENNIQGLSESLGEEVRTITLTVSGNGTLGGNLEISGATTMKGLLSFSGTNHAGIRVNNLTTAERDLLTPLAGMTIFNTTDTKMQVYNGTTWKNVGNPEISGEVTGGTAGSILFVDSGGSLAQDNSNFFWDDTNNRLGVGTTAPAARLDIMGNSFSESLVNQYRASSDASPVTYQFAKARGTIDVPSDVIDGDNFGLIQGQGYQNGGFRAGTNIRFLTDGTPSGNFVPGRIQFETGSGSASPAIRMTIKASGNIGIGTTTPASLLDVTSTTGGILTLRRNDTSVTADDMVGKLQFYAADASSTTNLVVADIEAQAVNTVASDINPGRLIFRTTGTDIAATPTERMRITEAGNLGVGDTSPDYLLELYDTTNTPAFALSDDDIAHGLTTLAETDVFSHLTSLSTTAGGAEWTAISDTNAQALSIRGIMGSTDPTDTTPAVKIVGAKSNGTTGMADLGAAETVFQIANNDDAAAVTVLGNGNVGIGLTNPSYTLHIGNNQNAGILGYIQNTTEGTASYAGFQAQSDSNTGGSLRSVSFRLYSEGYTGVAALQGLAVMASTNVPQLALVASKGTTTGTEAITFRLGSSATEYMRINEGGNVGIGTTSPSEKLQISGNIIVNGHGYFDSGNWAQSYGPRTDTAIIFKNYSGSELMRITNTGNVGIGTTNPGSLLNIVSSSYSTVTDYIKLSSNSLAAANGKGIGIHFEAEPTVSLGSYSVGRIYGIFDGNGYGSERLTLQSSVTGTLTDTMTLQNAKVAVGITDPYNNTGVFQIGGNRTGNPGGAYAAQGFYLQVLPATYTESYTANGGTATNMVFNSIHKQTLAASNPNVTTTNAASFYIEGAPITGTNQTITNKYALWVGGDNARFDGNVAIGMASPSVALDVTGDIEYTGTITDVSDMRLKENISDFNGALKIISALQAKNYNMIGDEREEVGFLAQDVRDLFPSATSIIDKEKGYLGVSYVSLVPVISQAVRELNLNLESIASPLDPILEKSFSERFFARLAEWMADSANGIGEVFGGTFRAKDKLCINDTCVTEEELKALIQNAGMGVSISSESSPTNPEEVAPIATEPASAPTDTVEVIETVESPLIEPSTSSESLTPEADPASSAMETGGTGEQSTVSP